MNNEQCKWLMKHQYDSIDNILEYMHHERVTLSTLFCTNKNSNISNTHLKCLIGLILFKMIETTHNNNTALAYIKKAQEYLTDTNNPLTLRILALIHIKLDKPSQELFIKSIELYSITLKHFIDSLNECNSDSCICYINGTICKNTMQNSELYRQLQYCIAGCREALLRVYISNQEYDNAIQLANTIINMDIRTIFGSFDDTALLYAHKVLAICYRYGYATTINNDKAFHHYKLSLNALNDITPLTQEQWLSDCHMELLNVSTISVTELNINMPISSPMSMGYIYTNIINKSLHNVPSSLIAINITLTLQSSAFICTPIFITAFCTYKNVIYIANYDMLMSQYSDTGVLNKLVSSMYGIVDDVIDHIVITNTNTN